MTWGVSATRRRPGELLTRGDVCHVHGTRDAAERCGAGVAGAPDLVRLERCSERVWRVLWSLSDTAGGQLRPRPVAAPAVTVGAFNAPTLTAASTLDMDRIEAAAPWRGCSSAKSGETRPKNGPRRRGGPARTMGCYGWPCGR